MKDKKLPSPLLSLLPIAVLVAMLAVTIYLFGSDALGGGEVADPAAVFILILQGVLAHAAEVPRDVGEQPAAVGLAGREHQASLAGLFLDDVKSIVNDLLSNTLLAVEHNTVDELGHQNAVIHGIRQNFSLGNITSSGHVASLLH